MVSIQCSLLQNRGYRWQKLKCSIGELFYIGNDWEIKASLNRWAIKKNIDINSLVQLLEKLPYHYAIVYQGIDVFFAAVDQVRTYPLFFYKKDNVLYFTDDPYKLKGIELQTNNFLTLAEFQLSGYAGAGDTLDRHLKSLPARHYLFASTVKDNQGYTVKEYLPRINNKAENNKTVRRILLDVGDKIFSEFCEGVSGRQIVLPLSSGYDSRYIAAMLKRHGHKNVVTYTYGKPGSWELGKSRETAERLGFVWYFIPYNRKLWRTQYESPEMQTYLPFASRHTSTPHIQDWPAVRKLKINNRITEDAIFVPGHTCVLISNRLEPLTMQQPSIEWVDLLARSLYRHHFILQRTKRVINSPDSLLRRIKKALPTDIDDDPQALLNAYFNFEAEERHGKMIINSVRVYEFWGHQWRLPLWDKRLIAAWAKVPYEGRYFKTVFREFLYQKNFYGLFPHPPSPGIYGSTRAKIKQTPLLFKPLKRVKCAEKRLFGYFHEYFDWFGIISYPKYVYHMGRCGDVYSLLSRLYLRYLDARQ